MLEESCSDLFIGKIWGNILYNRKPWFSPSNTEVKLACWKHITERWKYHQWQSAAIPIYIHIYICTRELGSHNGYVWKVPITRHPKDWEVQRPKWSMPVQRAKGSDTESTLMICLTSKRWGPQQPKLSSHTCHTWYLWQREGPPLPQNKRHCCRFKRGSLVQKWGNFWWIPNKEGMILTKTTPSSILGIIVGILSFSITRNL